MLGMLAVVENGEFATFAGVTEGRIRSLLPSASSTANGLGIRLP